MEKGSKKVKKTRRFAAALCAAATLLISYFLYVLGYKHTSDKEHLSAAITEYTSLSISAIDAYVLETKEMDGPVF